MRDALKQLDETSDSEMMESGAIIAHSFTTIDEVALAAVIGTNSDVVTGFSWFLRASFGSLEKMHLTDHLLPKLKRPICCIHVRFGDVEALSYRPDDFLKCYQATVNYINTQRDASQDAGMLKQFLRSKDNELCHNKTKESDPWSWGQVSMIDEHIRSVVNQVSRHLGPKYIYHFVTQKTNPILKRIVEDYKHKGIEIEIKDDETPEISLERMVSSEALVIANSYMGFLAGMIGARHRKVFFPPNAMFAIFGLGSQRDRSGWQALSMTTTTTTTSAVSPQKKSKQKRSNKSKK
jgi:hypothetical protein